MATLQGLKDQAMARGYEDARWGRLYRHSFTAYFRGLDLHNEYEAGWNFGRQERLDKAKAV